MKYLSSGSIPPIRWGSLTDRAQRAAFLCVKKSSQNLFRKRTAPPAVVFIAGVQRSGTNMMMDILERSMDTEVFNESDSRAFQDYELKPISTLEGLVRGSPAQSVVFKALCDLQSLKQLLDHFPDSKAVWMLRRMDDMVNSHCRAQFNKHGPTERNCNIRMNAIVLSPDSQGWRGRGMSSETRELLEHYCHTDISNESAVALFWFMRNKLYFEQNLHRHPRVKVIFYETFVRAPQDYSRELFSWLGLRVSRYASRRVTPRSIGRWVEPDIEPPIRALCEDLYRRFEMEAVVVSVDNESSRSNAVGALQK
jgi:hypothetical protein